MFYSPSFTSQVPLATWSPFGMSRTSFSVSSFLFLFVSAVLPFFSPSWCFAPSLYSLLSFEVVFFGPCGVCSLCSVWCLLLSSSPCQGSPFFVDPFPLLCFFRCLRVLVVPFTSSCSLSDLRFPFASGPPVRTSPFSSLHFSCFLFRGFRALPSSSVGLVPLFLLQAVVFTLSAFFLVGAPLFFLLGPFSGSLSSPSSGSSLGLLCLAFRILVGVDYFEFL